MAAYAVAVCNRKNAEMDKMSTIPQIQMVDLRGQYDRIKSEIDGAILDCIASTKFIGGPEVKAFELALARYLGVKHVVGCGNGTDALQIALMALELKPGDEVIVPAFTYVATAEVIGLLGLTPVMVDVDAGTFNVTADIIRAAITDRTKAVVPVHLFGQSCNMEPIMQVARDFGLFVVEDNAQAIGGDYSPRADAPVRKTGTVGHIGCTSFFPSKNLGCFGDGGAIFTNDSELANKIRTIANHGQAKKYYHSVIGVNSRLDSIQAAVLNVKLKYLNQYCEARQAVAQNYDSGLRELANIELPAREPSSTHVFHQYTLKVNNGFRDELRKHLDKRDIPSMIYYPIPLYRQLAFEHYAKPGFSLPATETLCGSVLSLPIHTEMSEETQRYIIEGVTDFFDTAKGLGVNH